MRELTDHAARAVAPVRASRRRRRRMREELLAHLTAAFAEERARLGDDRLALAQTLRRFGDPAALARELQATVPVWERVLYARVPASERFDRRLKAAALGTGAAPRRDALLLAGLFAALTFAMLVLLPLVKVAEGEDWSAARVPWVVTAALTGHAFVSGLLCLGYVRAVSRRGAPSLARAAAWGAAAVLWGAAFVPVMAAVKPDDPLWESLLRSPGRTAAAAGGAWAFLVVVAVVGRAVDGRAGGAAPAVG